jgi:hypothetical protein
LKNYSHVSRTKKVVVAKRLNSAYGQHKKATLGTGAAFLNRHENAELGAVDGREASGYLVISWLRCGWAIS